MLWQSVIILLILWYLTKLWKIRKVIDATRKLQNKFTALPLIGHAYLFLGDNEQHMNTLINFSKEAIENELHMTSLWLGMDHYTVIVDPNLFEFVSKKCLEKTRFAKFARKLIGNGSIFAPVNIWRPKRKQLAPTFSTTNLNDFCDIFSQQSLILATKLEESLSSEKFSVWPLLSKYTMDSVCETALGVQMHTQSNKEHPFLIAFDEYSTVGSSRILKPWLYFNAIYKFHPDCWILRKHKITIWTFVCDMIERQRVALKNLKLDANHSKVESPKSFLELLIESSDGGKLSNHQLMEEILVLLIAGTDTSAVGASFACVLLSRYPEIQTKVINELQQVLGDDMRRPIHHSDISKLKYLDAVIKETIRLYPPVPIIGRAVKEDVILPSTFTIPQDTEIILSIWGMHHNPKLWGEDVELFIPERFLNGVIPTGGFVPFSCGPRSCLGYKYAMMSMITVLATILGRYKILPVVPSEDMKKPLRIKFNTMMKHVDNFEIKLEPRV